jgi:ATP-dependent Clp protease ATP-binding subunit ClpC
MDDGRLTDGQGRTVDFKNTVVIMTSNVGTSELRKVGKLGFVTGHGQADETARIDDARKSHALEGLRRAFRPEFVNRIDQVIVFKSLSRESLRQIVDMMLAEVATRLQAQGIGLEIGDAVRGFLMEEGYNEEFGARPLRRAIQTHVDDVLADAILAGVVQPGSTARLSHVDGHVEVMSVTPAAVQVA